MSKGIFEQFDFLQNKKLLSIRDVDTLKREICLYINRINNKKA